jgi:hypothetical protein
MKIKRRKNKEWKEITIPVGQSGYIKKENGDSFFCFKSGKKIEIVSAKTELVFFMFLPVFITLIGNARWGWGDIPCIVTSSLFVASLIVLIVRHRRNKKRVTES